MRIINILPSFEKSSNKLSKRDKEKLKKSLHQLNNFLLFNTLPKGLGLKKLAGDLYELRVGMRLRVIFKMKKEIVYLILAGSHQDIRQYLKKIR